VCMVEIGRVRVKAGNAPIEQKISAYPPHRGSLNSTHIHGTDVPVEEPSTAS
jgi:hypothetical protein